MVNRMEIDEYMKKMASSDRTPGGGSAAALSSGLGAALALMTANLSDEKDLPADLTKENRETLDGAVRELKELSEQLHQIINQDTYAFQAVLDAMDLPAGDEEEKKKKEQRLEKATKNALETPLDAAEKGLNVLRLQEPIIKWGNQDTLSDIGAGIWLAYAGIMSALITVKINLLHIHDPDYRDKMRNRCKEIEEEAKEYLDRHLEYLKRKLEK